jgi:Cullin family
VACQDKDVFRDVYRSLLAKRLLLQKSFSPDAEKSAISLLKHACGPQYTYRIDGMITDLAVAKDLDKVGLVARFLSTLFMFTTLSPMNGRSCITSVRW